MGSTECQAVGIGEFPTSWDEPLDHGDETFGRHCNAGHDQDGALLHVIPAGPRGYSRHRCRPHAICWTHSKQDGLSLERLAAFHFQSVLDQCSVNHSDHAVALTSLACMRLEGYI
ncbi:hypothetical protein BDR07DRAFT_1041166 [Suillus spraguei]|nr:hypothetical protein BDR07DRAFT_1041166 [Suillus spraguei]